MMLKSCKETTDKSKAFRVLLIDLSKGFDYLNVEFFDAKLHAYDFDLAS